MSPFRARRGTRSLDRKAGLTASLIGILVVVAALAAFSRFLPAQIALPHGAIKAPHFRALGGLAVLGGDLGHTALRMALATGTGSAMGGVLALLAGRVSALEGPIRVCLGGLHMMPLLCLLPFLHLLGTEVALIGVAALCFAAPVASAALDSWSRIPRAFDDATRALGLTSWQRLWRLEAPFAIPYCVTALARAMPLAWCVLIGAEMLPVDGVLPTRPGLGTHAMQAAALGSVKQSFLSAGLLALLVAAYDLCLVFPSQIWADRYRISPVFDDNTDPLPLRLWRRTRFLKRGAERFRQVLGWVGTLRLGGTGARATRAETRASPLIGLSSLLFLLLIALGFFYRHHALDLRDLERVTLASLLSALRVTLALCVALLVWVPVGVWLSLPPSRSGSIRSVARFCVLYPKNVLFPLLVLLAIAIGLGNTVWPLLLVLFHVQFVFLAQVLRGMRSFPPDLLRAAQNLQLRGWLWWRRVLLPGLAPALLEGVSAASFAGWSILILAERNAWRLQSHDGGGIGAFVARAIATGDLPRVVLGAAVLTLCIALGEILVWHPVRLQIRRRMSASSS